MHLDKNLICSALALSALLGSPALCVQGAAPSKPAGFPNFLPFSQAAAEFAEGVAVDKVGNVFVSMRQSPMGPLPVSDEIWKFAPDGTKTIFADFGLPGGGGCGLAVDPEGNVYMARTGTAAPYQGVYRVTVAGESALMPGTDEILFADGLAFDPRGNLYITEAFSTDPASGEFAQGGIWRVPKRGTAQLWLRHELLTGLAPLLFEFPVGANGIAFYHNDLYVINTDKALVVRIPVLADGSPGQAEVWKQLQDVPESIFYQHPFFTVMPDGLALDVHGNVYVAVPSRLAVIRINAVDRSQTTLAVYPQVPLDACYSLAFGTGKGERQSLFITNSGFLGVILPGLPWPGPGLVKIDAGTPGLPLP